MFVLRSKWVSLGLAGLAGMLAVESAEAQQVGHASWYALYSRTASGEMMNPSALTAAHRSLPFGTKVLVENLSNGRSVVVRINDRGPFVGGRVIDLSKAAAAHIGMVGSGTAKVRITTGGGSEIAAAGASEKVASGKELVAKAAADEPADQSSLPPVRLVEAAARRPASRKTASRRTSAKHHVASKSRTRSTQVASRTRAKGAKVAAKTRAPRKTGSHVRVASVQKSNRARGTAKHRNVPMARLSPYSGFAPSALIAG